MTPSHRCGHKWRAPYLLSPTAPREIIAGNIRIPVKGDTLYVEQECSLPKGHDGTHRSLSNVVSA